MNKAKKEGGPGSGPQPSMDSGKEEHRGARIYPSGKAYRALTPSGHNIGPYKSPDLLKSHLDQNASSFGLNSGKKESGPVSIGIGNAVHTGTSPFMRGGVLVQKGIPQAKAKDEPGEKKEADSGSTQVAQLRPQKSKESQPYDVKIRTHFRESTATQRKNRIFKVVLIQEGLGNLRDCFYYTKESLTRAAQDQVFEGKKCFADHPSSIEEEARPERSTRDIVGYFQNVTYEEAADGVGQLNADLCVMNDAPNEWALSLLDNAIDYSQKYKGSDFIGLSINASGQAISVPIDQFVGTIPIPEAVMSKINEAIAQGLTDIRPVSLLKEAISVDLVTEAGAGGKILKLIEGEKKPMKKQEAEKKESTEMEKKKESMEMEGQEGEGMDSGHDDADQDKMLFQKMIKQYLGKDDASAEEMEMAKHAFEACKGDGMGHEAAYEGAGKHLKMSSKIGQSMLAKKGKEAMEAEAKQAEMEKKEAEKKEAAEKECGDKKEASEKKETKEETKESKVIQLSAEVASLKESLKKYQLNEHLDSKLRESKFSNSITKKFREALGTPKSKAHIDESFSIFVKALDVRTEEVGSDMGFVFTEKSNFTESDQSVAGLIDLSNCVE